MLCKITGSVIISSSDPAGCRASREELRGHPSAEGKPTLVRRDPAPWCPYVCHESSDSWWTPACRCARPALTCPSACCGSWRWLSLWYRRSSWTGADHQRSYCCDASPRWGRPLPTCCFTKQMRSSVRDVKGNDVCVCAAAEPGVEQSHCWEEPVWSSRQPKTARYAHWRTWRHVSEHFFIMKNISVYQRYQLIECWSAWIVDRDRLQ